MASVSQPSYNERDVKTAYVVLPLLKADLASGARLRDIFTRQVVETLPPKTQSHVGRLQPVFDLSPRQVVSLYDQLPFFKSQLEGISGEKTFQEAIYTKLFHLALAAPDSSALILWYHIANHCPIQQREWEKIPREFALFYPFLPLLQERKIQEFFPEHPVVSEQLSPSQLKGSWTLWTEHFCGLYDKLQTLMYQQLDHWAETHLLRERGRGSGQNRGKSIFKKFPHHELERLFSAECINFLRKHEHLAPHKNRISSVREKIKLHEDPTLLRALIYDHIRPTIPVMREIAGLANVLENKFLAHFQKNDMHIFKDQRLSLAGPASTKKTLKEIADSWHDIALNASILSLFSDHLCQDLRHHLHLQAVQEGNVYPRVEESLRRKIAYHSLALDDFEDQPVERGKKRETKSLRKDDDKESQDELPETAPAAPARAPTPPPALDHLKLQREADLRCLDQPEMFGSVTPYSATLAELMENREVGEHCYLMAQGLELFANTVKRGDFSALPTIFRNILVDGHVALEQFFVDRILSSGRSNPHLHDLKTLAELSGCELTEEEKQFLESARLSLHWARYPACSEEYFATRENQPPLLKALLDFSQNRCSSEATAALDAFVQNVFQIVIPKDLMDDRFKRRIHELAVQPLPSESIERSAPLSEPFCLLIDRIHGFMRTQERNSTPHVLSALSHLKEAVYYLQWIDSSKRLESLHRARPMKFWFQRNALEVDKLFKHLFAAWFLLQEQPDPREHRHGKLFEALKEFCPLERKAQNLIRSFNMGNALHYHTWPSPLDQAYPNLLREDLLQAHGLRSGKKIVTWPDFDQALRLFDFLLEKALGHP